MGLKLNPKLLGTCRDTDKFNVILLITNIITLFLLVFTFTSLNDTYQKRIREITQFGNKEVSTESIKKSIINGNGIVIDDLLYLVSKGEVVFTSLIDDEDNKVIIFSMDNLFYKIDLLNGFNPPLPFKPVRVDRKISITIEYPDSID